LKLFSFLLLLAGAESALLISPVEAAFGTCGNGVVDKFEQCDDGNLNNGDGCSSLCQKEGDGFPVVVYTADDPPPTQPSRICPFSPRLLKTVSAGHSPARNGWAVL